MTRTSSFPIDLHDIKLRRQLIASGWTDRDIARAVRSGLIHRIRYGAYVDACLWSRIEGQRDEHRVRARAVLRTAHSSSVLTHQSSAAEWEIPLWRLCLDDVSLTRTDEVSGRREAGITHHAGRLPLDQITVRHGVPVSTAGRTAVELLSTTDAELGYCLLNGFLNLGHTRLEEVRRIAAQTERWPNTLGTRIAIGLADPRLGSVAESRFMFLCFREGVPLPEPQVEVRDETSQLLGFVDFLWRKHRLFVEFDGRIKYEVFRRPGESLADYIQREKRREELIVRATGWMCIRITWADLADPSALARRILAILASRAPTAA
ncbi:type IV toxin-antitoxin system AbiEi family antitoxin domain-containing protein [Nocardioides KLBMP 9356]|uniref:Type IV toxin-antitoxin system AbiEi family antitoxin domain-containing protein n=1 Tax=Nocardioides potassii TaxID=2911371 RepID=A0ABS9H916_9ACTN|nr:type IV toxin-antitoxin system AbiEi family antitoxin domain-containing protein [Nocardioides potassii]MCF6377715.1 type IV toxin-antitoxin system AbiEi family antitoxin domain-containing protein [Nocardioides potassii]